MVFSFLPIPPSVPLLLAFRVFRLLLSVPGPTIEAAARIHDLLWSMVATGCFYCTPT